MHDTQIGPEFLLALGMLFTAYGADQITRAYRIISLDAWVVTVLPAAGAVVIGALLAWSGLRLGSGV